MDLVEPPEIPHGFRFVKMDVLMLCAYQSSGRAGIDAHFNNGGRANVCSYNPHYDEPALNCNSEPFDFICASSPCEQFSVHGMKHFHPNPPYPELGIKLFEHTRALCEASGVPYVMENVRAAQKFVGNAVHHCGPFYLWGSGVPPLMNGGIKKGLDMGRDPITGKRTLHLGRRSSHKSKARAADKSLTATIPPELSSCVCAYAERLLEQKGVACGKTG